MEKVPPQASVKLCTMESPNPLPSVVREAEIGLSLELCRKILVGVPKKHRSFHHMLEIKSNSLANVAGLLKLGDALDGLVAHPAANTAVSQLLFQLIKVTFKSQCHSEAILAHKHHIIVRAAKTGFICSDSDVGLHHRCAEDQLQLVLFKLFADFAFQLEGQIDSQMENLALYAMRRPANPAV